MNRPLKRTSDLLNKVRFQRNPKDFQRLKGKMHLAAKIAAGIREKGWNKSQFAEAIDQTPSTVSRWLSGHHNFTVETLNDIEYILGIELLNWEKTKYEAGTNVNGVIDSNVSFNIFLTEKTYSEISENGNILVEISSNANNIQVVKKCDSVLN
jgi:transcriptional regulator with XRE-family HTH domain